MKSEPLIASAQLGEVINKLDKMTSHSAARPEPESWMN
jgi:hypothetical protein